MSKVNWLKIILVVGLVALLTVVYLQFFYTQKCNTRDCFDIALVQCKRASYTNQGMDATWFYSINGKEKDTCVVYVKNLRLYRAEEAEKIVNKDMVCYLPLGALVSPESSIDVCHGLLKEAMQDLIIEKMHLYIIQNIGQIAETANLTKVL